MSENQPRGLLQVMRIIWSVLELVEILLGPHRHVELDGTR